MRFGVKALILWRQVDAGGFNHAQTGDGSLRQYVSGIRTTATVGWFSTRLGRYFAQPA